MGDGPDRIKISDDARLVSTSMFVAKPAIDNRAMQR